MDHWGIDMQDTIHQFYKNNIRFTTFANLHGTDRECIRIMLMRKPTNTEQPGIHIYLFRESLESLMRRQDGKGTGQPIRKPSTET